MLFVENESMNPVGVREIEMHGERDIEKRDIGRRLSQMVFNSEKQH